MNELFLCNLSASQGKMTALLSHCSSVVVKGHSAQSASQWRTVAHDKTDVLDCSTELNLVMDENIYCLQAHEALEFFHTMDDINIISSSVASTLVYRGTARGSGMQLKLEGQRYHFN